MTDYTKFKGADLLHELNDDAPEVGDGVPAALS